LLLKKSPSGATCNGFLQRCIKLISPDTMILAEELDRSKEACAASICSA
jgi:hypothetical protein